LLDKIVNALTVDVEEYSGLGGDGIHSLPGRVAGQTQRLLDLLDAHRAHATFFTLGLVAQQHPRLVREIVARGHEVACHGWDHAPVFRLGPAGFRADVRRAKHAVEQAAGRIVRGYRAPSYSIRRDTPWAFTVLAEEGFVYDSSINPVAHDRYAFAGAPRFAHVVRNVDGVDFWEFPIGTVRVGGVNMPFGGRCFRLFPAALLRAAMARVNTRERRPVVFHVPPRERERPSRRPVLARRIHHGSALTPVEHKLADLLGAFPFGSIETVFSEVRPARRVPARAS
jgi:polysaccharide deacetylase family protein (PEP-CTERM system associated)